MRSLWQRRDACRSWCRSADPIPRDDVKADRRPRAHVQLQDIDPEARRSADRQQANQRAPLGQRDRAGVPGAMLDQAKTDALQVVRRRCTLLLEAVAYPAEQALVGVD